LTPNSAEIEELVRIAAEEADPAANKRLFRALRSVEVFFPMETGQHASGGKKATPLLRLPDGTRAMMLYTSKSHPDLPGRFGGGSFRDALAAALKMPVLDWVIVSNRASQWVAVGKSQIPAVLDDLRSGEHAASSSFSSSESRPADQSLEALITRAVHSEPEQLSPAIPSLLQGRELYLELNAEKVGDAGQPVMKTISVEHMANVIRAYLTRSRPGIAYGGITWEALKEMVNNEAQIQGVQLINDSDDWVIFDRESLGCSDSNE
jgi:hypothetical protein